MMLVAFEVAMENDEAPPIEHRGWAIRRVPGQPHWLLLELNGQSIILTRDEAARLVADLEAALSHNR